MFDELDVVVLTHPIKETGLKKGDLGTIVHLYGDKKAMEVEFVAASGRTIMLTIGISYLLIAIWKLIHFNKKP